MHEPSDYVLAQRDGRVYQNCSSYQDTCHQSFFSVTITDTVMSVVTSTIALLAMQVSKCKLSSEKVPFLFRCELEVLYPVMFLGFC